jgi:hypothetical protein
MTKDDDVRLTALKEELKSSSLKTKHYQTATELSQQFIRDFKEIIDQDFPLATVPGPLQRERVAHIAFQESRARVYIGNLVFRSFSLDSHKNTHFFNGLKEGNIISKELTVTFQNLEHLHSLLLQSRAWAK